MEVIVALVLLATATLFLSNGLSTSIWANAQARTRTFAAQIASATIQTVDNLGYATVSEGIECPLSGPGPCSALAQPDPNGQLQYDQSNGCWYFGGPGNGLLVPTTQDSSSSGPVIPYVSGTSSYPSPVKDGVVFTVATYPMIRLSQYSAVSCTTESNGTAPDVPVTVLVEVSWYASGRQRLSMQTVLYSPPSVQSPSVSGNCPGSTFKLSGAHLESLLASPFPAPSITSGSQAYIFFLDEAPTPYAPTFCIQDSSGADTQVTISYTETSYGTSSSDPFLPTGPNSTCTPQGTCSTVMTAVNPSYGASGPNAAAPPAGGTYCSGPGCSAEVEIEFTVPSIAPSGLNVTGLTITAWDHEGDMDIYTWQVQP